MFTELRAPIKPGSGVQTGVLILRQPPNKHLMEANSVLVQLSMILNFPKECWEYVAVFSHVENVFLVIFQAFRPVTLTQMKGRLLPNSDTSTCCYLTPALQLVVWV